MNYCCYRKQDDISKQLQDLIVNTLNSRGWIYDDTNPVIVITIGGDGTVLSAVSKYIDRLDKVVFVGIHTGSLGFFNDFMTKEVLEFVNLLLTKTPVVEQKRMVMAEYNGRNFYALNEIRIENNTRTQTLNVEIDNQQFEVFRGSGLCLSTQAGSTGYNRSVNGAILDTNLQLLQLSEIVPIRNMHYRTIGTSFVLNPDRVVRISSDDFSDCVLAFDHLYVKIQDGNMITCKLADKWVNFAHYKDISYFTRLKTLF